GTCGRSGCVKRTLTRGMPQILRAANTAGCAARAGLLGKLLSLRQQIEFVHRSAQLCKRCEPHLPHHVTAMYFDRALAYPHVGGDLLVQPTLCNLGQHAELTPRQGVDSSP